MDFFHAAVSRTLIFLRNRLSLNLSGPKPSLVSSLVTVDFISLVAIRPVITTTLPTGSPFALENAAFCGALIFTGNGGFNDSGRVHHRLCGQSAGRIDCWISVSSMSKT
jgi:hypothetical protein